MPATFAGIAAPFAGLAAQLSDGRPLSVAGALSVLLSAFLSVSSARGSRRVASEVARLQEGLADLEQKGVLRSDLHEERFRQLVREHLKEAGRDEDEQHREQLRHVLFRGSMSESSTGRATMYFDIARRLKAQDIELLKGLRNASETFEKAYDGHNDVRALELDLFAKLELRHPDFNESFVLLMREGLKEAPSSAAIVSAGPENHRFHVTQAGLMFLEWISWPPYITV